jgi:hypothetical protein
MKQTIGDLWSRYTNPANWLTEPRYLGESRATAALDRFTRVLEIGGYVIAIERGLDYVDRPVWHWSIYRGKAEWYTYLVEGVWSPVDYASESETRAAAWSTLVKIVAGPAWPPEPPEMVTEVFEFPEDKAEREALEAAEK